ncbi:ATP-dependent DNA ligase [Herbiconiux sp. CPCC 205716]|uniref:ATP-dependent DNA ligase n=1 Tax=Herbiconiux gentiana TaxID=2970912 RepID=A0ABT2GC28_9MICO|nr:ATP-dependent DNA ligase [Herbiconiux gentiana]MCS5713758.1 ATP-dependent DNA ligase [Herbiconiux gentiana]
MGTLIYGGDFELEVDDRMLAHLQVVIIGRLRRAESCALSWSVPKAQGSGRETIWLNPHTALRFRFDSAERHTINPAWVALISETANRGDIQLVQEPQTAAG